MQPTENFSVPRRALDIDDYIDILRRHKGWIFGPFLFTLVASVVGVYLWPDSYDSSATIAIRPQQISEAMFPSLSNQDIMDRISSLAQKIESRSELTAMIRNMNLYPRERNRMPLEDVLEIMRRSIRLTPMSQAVSGNRSIPAFEVAFTYSNRLEANKVVQALVSKFIDEDSSVRNTRNFQGLEFMQARYDSAKQELDRADQKMLEFRLANPGKQPEQMPGNIAAMGSINTNISNLSNQINSATNQKLEYENQIRALRSTMENAKSEAKMVVAQAPPKVKSAKEQQWENQLENLNTQMATLRKTFKEDWPAVKNTQKLIDVAEESLKKVREEEAGKAAAAAAATVQTPEVNLALVKKLQDGETQIEYIQGLIANKDAEIERFKKQIVDQNGQLGMLQGRLQSMPVGDQAYNEIQREQRLASEAYVTANANLERAKASSEIEQRQQGEKLEPLDSPSVPQDPTAPNRPMIISMGAGLGLILGIVFAGAREMKDTSLKNLKDVRAYTQMTILGSVPLLENDFVVRRRRRISWLSWTVACLSAVLVMAGSIIYYYEISRNA